MVMNVRCGKRDLISRRRRGYLDNRHDDVRLEGLAGVYVQLVSKLNNTNLSLVEHAEGRTGRSSSKKLCVITNNGRYMNFRANDFKRVLVKLIDSNQLPKFMIAFRTLEWIICKSGRFTNVQFIEGKSVRVITVDLEKFQLLKRLIEFAEN